MSRFIRTEKESQVLVNASWWRLLLILVTMDIVFIRHGKSQVDNSKALIWSTTFLDGRAVLTLLYGDPEVYVADIAMQSDQTNITSYSIKFLTSNGFGVLETRYQPSIVYFYSSQNIYFSTEFIQNTADEYHSSWLFIVAVSDQVTGFALDWVSGLLYWSDAGYRRICLINTNTILHWRSVVDTNVTSPQDVVVYPQQSYLFWSDLGDDPKIERLDLTNDQREVLVSNGTLQRPTTLAIDVANQRLFWLDSAKETIGSITFDGSDISFWSLSLFSSISSFVLYQNYIFFGDNAQSTIYNVTQRQYLANITASIFQRGIIDMTMWSPERQPQVSSPCTSLNGGCDQFCITVSATSRRCMCAMGFFLASSGSTCVTKPFETDRFLLVTDEWQINTFQIDVETGEVRALTNNERVVPTAMDLDPIGKCFYWFDNTNKRIKRTALDNSYSEVFLDGLGNEITSLAVDTLSRNLYYADYGAGTIGQISLSTAKNKTLLATAGSLPWAIVLDISNRLMYWSDCGYSTIDRGSIANPTINRQSIVSGLPGCVTAFAIDFQGQVIYWGYHFGRIERAKLDGTMRTTIHEENQASYSGLALDSRYLYIADSKKRQIQKLDRSTNQVTNLTKNLFTKPYALLYYANYIPSTTAASITTSTSSASETATTWTSSGAFVATTEFESTTIAPTVPPITIILATVIPGAIVLIVIVTLGVIFGLRHRKDRRPQAIKLGEMEQRNSGGYETLILPGLVSTAERVGTASGLVGNTYASSSISHATNNNHSQLCPPGSKNDKCTSLYNPVYDELTEPDLEPPVPPPRPSEIIPEDSDDYLKVQDSQISLNDHTDIYNTNIQ